MYILRESSQKQREKKEENFQQGREKVLKKLNNSQGYECINYVFGEAD